MYMVTPPTTSKKTQTSNEKNTHSFLYTSDVSPTMRTMIEYFRIKRGMTIQDLSNETDIDVQNLIKYENGAMFPRSQDINLLQNVLDTRFIHSQITKD